MIDQQQRRFLSSLAAILAKIPKADGVAVLPMDYNADI